MENLKEKELVVSGEVVAAADEMSKLAKIRSGEEVSFYCSIPDDGTRESKIAVYNAINNNAVKLGDMIGKEIKVTNIAAHPVRIVSDEDGEIMDVTRVVFIGENGETYESVAQGIFSSVEKIFGIIGFAPWEPSITIVPKEVRTRKGYKTLTLDLK